MSLPSVNTIKTRFLFLIVENAQSQTNSITSAVLGPAISTILSSTELTRSYISVKGAWVTALPNTINPSVTFTPGNKFFHTFLATASHLFLPHPQCENQSRPSNQINPVLSLNPAVFSILLDHRPIRRHVVTSNNHPANLQSLNPQAVHVAPVRGTSPLNFASPENRGI